MVEKHFTFLATDCMDIRGILGSILGRGKKILFYLNLPKWPLGPPSLIQWVLTAFLLGVKQPELQAIYLRTVLKLRMRGTVSASCYAFNVATDGSMCSSFGCQLTVITWTENGN